MQLEGKWKSRPGIVYEYSCNHPAYWHCTLFKIEDKGLAVIQQKFDPAAKKTWWESLHYWVAEDIYTNKGFKEYFDKHAGYEVADGSYPTVTVRQIMHALKMKPLKKEPWETRF